MGLLVFSDCVYVLGLMGRRRDDIKGCKFVAGFKNSFKILYIFILKKCNTAWKPQLLNINHVEPLTYV